MNKQWYKELKSDVPDKIPKIPGIQVKSYNQQKDLDSRRVDNKTFMYALGTVICLGLIWYGSCNLLTKPIPINDSDRSFTNRLEKVTR
jgi:hypothetical protein